MKDSVKIVIMLITVVLLIQTSLKFFFTPEKTNISHYIFVILIGSIFYYNKIKGKSNY